MEKHKQTIYIFTSFITEKVSERGHHITIESLNFTPPYCGEKAEDKEAKGETLGINYKIIHLNISLGFFPDGQNKSRDLSVVAFFRN